MIPGTGGELRQDQTKNQKTSQNPLGRVLTRGVGSPTEYRRVQKPVSAGNKQRRRIKGEHRSRLKNAWGNQGKLHKKTPPPAKQNEERTGCQRTQKAGGEWRIKTRQGNFTSNERASTRSSTGAVHMMFRPGAAGKLSGDTSFE